MKPVIVLVVAFLALAALAATQAIQRNFFTVNTAPVVQATAGTNVFVTFTQAGQTRTYLVDVPTPSSLPFSVVTNAPWLTNNQSTAVNFNNTLQTHSGLFDVDNSGNVGANSFSAGGSSIASDGTIHLDSGTIISDGLGMLSAQIFNAVVGIHGNGLGVSNVVAASVAATNVFSGGQLPIGTVSTGLSSVAGPLLTSNGVARSYSYNGGGLSNLNASALASGTVPLTLLGGATNQVLSFGSAAGWSGSPNLTNITLVGELTNNRYFVSRGAAMTLQTASGTSIQMSPGGPVTWVFNSSGHHYPNTDNSYDLGQTTARVRTFYCNTGQFSGPVFATNAVFGAYGCATMSTGTVVVATSTSTNTFTGWSYLKTFGGIGSLTNTSIVVTNAGDYRISFGCSLLGGNGDAVKALILTNDVVCPLIMFEKTMQNPAIAETGFKEVVVNLPASCRVGIGIANGSANNTSVQNLCFNVKGAN